VAGVPARPIKKIDGLDINTDRGKVYAQTASL
jgi:hypothetical protein